MLHANQALSAAIELSVARDLARLVDKAREMYPDQAAESMAIAGGRAVWLGLGAPVNMSCGMGFSGVVSASEIDAVERFYADRGERAAISFSPLADLTLAAVLARRGWVVTGFENVLVREMADLSVPARATGVSVGRADSADDRELWATLSGRAFRAPHETTPDQHRLDRVMAHRRDVVQLFGLYRGEPAGTGALWVDGDLAWLLADATLPDYRGRGIQSALQVRRLELAREAGCRLAVTESVPGSASQRNMERLGFQVAYTRIELMGPSPA